MIINLLFLPLLFGKLVFVNCQIPYITNGACVEYNRILPAGACLNYMKNAKVLVNLKELDKLNGLLANFYEVYLPSFLNIMSVKSREEIKVLIRNALIKFTCLGKVAASRELVNILVDSVPSYNELVEILPIAKWLVCYMQYPICFDIEPIEISLPCRYEHDLVLTKLSIVRNVIHQWNELLNFCPEMNTIANNFIFKTGDFSRSDIHYIERCQKYTKSTDEKECTTDCYDGVGLKYNGSVAVDRHGRNCIAWKLIPALRSNIYSSLISNYCRNPQGYGKSPWCYTDKQSREIAYCQIEACIQRKDSTQIHKLTTGNYISVYIVISCISIGVIAIILRFIINNKRNQNKVIDPYYTYPLNSPEQLKNLLFVNDDVDS